MSAKAKSKLTPEQQKATMTRVLQKIKPYGFFVVCSLIVAAVSVAAQLYIPILCGNAIDMMLGKGAVDFAGVLRIIYEIIVVAVVAAFAQWLLSVCNNRITFAVSRDLRNAAMRKIQTLPLSYLDSHPSGDIVSRMVADVDTFADGLLMGFTQLFSGVLTILGTLLFMLQQNVPITLVVVCITPLSLVVASFLAKRSYKYFQSQSTVRGEQTALVNEMIEGQKVVQAFGHEAQSLEAFDEVNGRLQNVSLKAIFFSSMTNPATRFVNNIVYAGVGLVGAIYAVAGGITIGQLSIFLNYANQYTKPFNEISGVVTELQNALACAARVFELLDAEDQTPEAENAAKLVPDGHVQIEDVSFRYLPDRPLIEGLSLDVKPGQRIAIVGPTGCGKTTLINLLMRFYDVNSGSIKVSGTDIRDVTRASLRGSYGMVLQDTWLRAGTVRENIAYGKPDASLDEVVAAAKAAHADSFIRRLPEGYDTVIAEDGGNISQGQKQLLCIARVMLCLPPMLILDEATSSIDTRMELKIQNAFAQLMRGRTSFVVAHRLSTIENADCILVMNAGEPIELKEGESRQVADVFGVKVIQDSTGGLRFEDREGAEEEIGKSSVIVPEKGEYFVILSDGTKVWINSDSELEFPNRFGEDIREVKLKGEAYFEVTSDSRKPFYVLAGETKVHVLGTAFNVSAYREDRQTEVALLRGKVSFDVKDKVYVLVPGEIATLNRESGETIVRKGDVAAIVDWKAGRFNFEDMSLEELTVKLSRWYGVTFVFSDEAVKKLRFSGAMTKYRTLDYVLDMISKTTDVTFSLKENRVTVSSKK